MIAGLIPIYNCPFAWFPANMLMLLCDMIYLRFDVKGDRNMLESVERNLRLSGKYGGTIESDAEFNWWIFREELIRMLDDVKPELVLFPDEDEVFDAHMKDELQEFAASDKMGMMFKYHAPMPTVDNVVLFNGKSYPTGPLMKAFKWQEGLTYKPYHGWTRVTNYQSKEMHWMAETKILHYSHYTESQRATHKMNW